MKINFVSFSDYSSELEVYNLEKMDLFVFLLVKIIENGSEKTIKDVLLDIDITDALLYLYQNNFYYLLDNGLLINNGDSEDIGSIKVNDLKFSEFGKYCLSINRIPKLEKKEYKKIIYNPLKRELVSSNKVNESTNVVVYENNVSYLKLINDNKKAILNRYDDFVLNYDKLEADPYYFEIDVNSENLDDDVKRYLKNNCMPLAGNKRLREDKKEFLSSNFRAKLLYGKEGELARSDYYLIVSEEKKYTVSDNKIYIEGIIKEFDDYSFVEIGRDTRGFNVGELVIDDIKASCVESFKLKDYRGDIKKYLLKNREKYKNDKIINSVIDML